MVKGCFLRFRDFYNAKDNLRPKPRLRIIIAFKKPDCILDIVSRQTFYANVENKKLLSIDLSNSFLFKILKNEKYSSFHQHQLHQMMRVVFFDK